MLPAPGRFAGERGKKDWKKNNEGTPSGRISRPRSRFFESSPSLSRVWSLASRERYPWMLVYLLWQLFPSWCARSRVLKRGFWKGTREFQRVYTSILLPLVAKKPRGTDRKALSRTCVYPAPDDLSALFLFFEVRRVRTSSFCLFFVVAPRQRDTLDLATAEFFPPLHEIPTVALAVSHSSLPCILAS